MRREDPELDLHIREIMSVEPTLVPRDTEVVRAFQEAGRAVLGREPGFSVSPGSDDQKFVVQEAGLEQCIVYGPGPLEVAHQADEFQPVADLKQATAVLALAALRLLGEEARE
jgi:succinyl-diaminopimelate desuccinylase